MSHAIRTPEKREILLDYCSRFKGSPTLTVARAIWKKHSRLWPNLEAVRCSVRDKRGNHGVRNRKYAKKDFIRPNGVPGHTYNFPKSYSPSYDPFVLEDCEALIMSDLHIPFHDPAACLATISAGKQRNPNVILLNGDVCDFFSLSRFDKNPNESSLKRELDLTREFLGWLRQEFPKARIIYKLGNHDEWFEKYLHRKAPEFFGVEQITLPHLLTEKTKTKPEIGGIEWVDDQRRIKAGHLSIWHGHEIGKGSVAPPVNPARGLFLRTLDCGLMGHLHKRSSHEETTSRGKLIACWSTGCLCGLWPRYARVNKWGHSAAFLELKSGNFSVEEIRILNGKVL